MNPEKLRAPLQWYGGKGMMVAKLLPLLPPGGAPYCEPYAGGASLFFAREPAPVEVLNDTDGDLVTLYRLLQDRATFEELRHRLMWTPYARAELERALAILADYEAQPIDRAWAKFVAHNLGMSGRVPKNLGHWSRTFVSTSGMAKTTNARIMRLAMLDAYHGRLMRAQIDNRDAIEVIRYWDCDDAVFYVDPPYHDSIKATQSLVFRAEGMEKALKDIRSLSSISAMNPNPFALTVMLGDIHHIADTALMKENSND